MDKRKPYYGKPIGQFPNLLESKYDEASPEFQHMAVELVKARRKQTGLTFDQYDRHLGEAENYIRGRYNNNNMPQWIQAIRRAVEFPRFGMAANKDVNREALGKISHWIFVAVEMGYNLEDPDVVEAFAHFCLQHHTKGWIKEGVASTTDE